MTSSADARYAFGDEDRADAQAQKDRAAEHAGTRKAYDKMTPEEVFQEFDTDGSGAIDWAEFKAMLPQVHPCRCFISFHRISFHSSHPTPFLSSVD